jgi:hypothetical protein
VKMTKETTIKVSKKVTNRTNFIRSVPHDSDSTLPILQFNTGRA